MSHTSALRPSGTPLSNRSWVLTVRYIQTPLQDASKEKINCTRTDKPSAFSDPMRWNRLNYLLCSNCFQHPSALLGIDSLKSIPWSYLPYSAKCSLHKCSLTVSLAFTWSEGVLVNTVVRGGWNVIFFLLGLVLNNHSPLSMDLSEIPTRNTWSKSKTLLKYSST